MGNKLHPVASPSSLPVPLSDEASSPLLPSPLPPLPPRSLLLFQPKASAPAVTPAPVAPVTPLPAPSLFNKAPEPAVKPPKAPEPVQQKKAAPEAAKPAAADSKKRRGPLPLWFAEVLVLGAYAGMFLAVTKYSKQSGEVLAGLWAKVVEAYNALDKMIGSKKQAV